MGFQSRPPAVRHAMPSYLPPSGRLLHGAAPLTTISTTVTATVRLGAGQYGDQLIVTDTGIIAPASAGAAGVVAPAALKNVFIANYGAITGGAGAAGQGSGASGATGGVGVDLSAAGTLLNTGVITGGLGGAGTNSGSGGEGGTGGTGGAGVYLGAGATLDNEGTITGGAGGIGPYSGAGGAGVRIDGAWLTNSGRITGGSGADWYGGGAGGTGVNVQSTATIVNHGTISGGAGGYDYPHIHPDNAGAVGVAFRQAGALINAGTIDGGAGGRAEAFAGAGGDGVRMSGGGSVLNTGAISGGVGGASRYSNQGSGGVGIVFDGPGIVINRGTISGGAAAMPGRDPASAVAGGDGADMAAGSRLINSGTVTGGVGGFGHPYGGNGGRGVNLDGAWLSNSGTISGGAGGVAGGGQFGQPGVSGAGGTGVAAAQATVTNTGLIEGGAGGSTDDDGTGHGNGGAGVNLLQAGTLTNSATILGGAGGAALYELGPGGVVVGHGGLGGAGVRVASGATAANSGVIIGGAGGYVQDAISTAGSGGVGAYLAAGGSLLNRGSISGGAGGAASAISGPGIGVGARGGDGVDLRGGVLVNTGTITAGAGGHGITQNGPQGVGVYINGGEIIDSGTISGADAVQFGNLAGTLVVGAAAVFDGRVVANASATDVLQLAGGAAGTISSLGALFTGFTTIVESAGATWTLGDYNDLAAATALQVGGALDVATYLYTDGKVTVVGHGDLAAGTSAYEDLAAGAVLLGGTLTGSATAEILIGTYQPPLAGAITISRSSTISGFGAINGAPVINDGTIAAQGGTLTLSTGITGDGAMTIASGATLQIADSAASNTLSFTTAGDARLALGTPADDGSVILTGFAATDTIDLLHLKATALSFLNGTLSLQNGGTTVAELQLAGTYTAANFALATDGNGGTDISFAATGNAAIIHAPAVHEHGLLASQSGVWAHTSPPDIWNLPNGHMVQW